MPRLSIRRLLLGLLALLVLIQLVPYGRDHSAPASTRRAQFPDARTRTLFAGACGDCHSNHTTWPVYSYVAPVSWLVYRDVKEGRQNFDVDNWDRSQPDIGDIAEQISGGGMPPLQYKPLHPKSRLSASEKQALIAGLRKLYATDPPAATHSGGG